MNVPTPKKQPQIEPLSVKQIVLAVDLLLAPRRPSPMQSVSPGVSERRLLWCMCIHRIHYGAHSRLLCGRSA